MIFYDIKKEIDFADYFINFLAEKINVELLQPLCDKYNFIFEEENDDLDWSFYFYNTSRPRIWGGEPEVRYIYSLNKIGIKKDFNKFIYLIEALNMPICGKTIGSFIKTYDPRIY